MDISSLPTYPTHRRPGLGAGAEKAGQGLSPRAVRIVRDLAALVAIVALLYWLRRTATAIEHPPGTPPTRPPFDFKLVEMSFGKVRLFASREEVYELLGPPSSINRDWGPDLRRWAERAEHSNRHLGIPDGGFWDLWTDQGMGARG